MFPSVLFIKKLRFVDLNFSFVFSASKATRCVVVAMKSLVNKNATTLAKVFAYSGCDVVVKGENNADRITRLGPGDQE